MKFELYGTIISLHGLKSTKDMVVDGLEIHKLTSTKGILLKLTSKEKKGEAQQEFHPQVKAILQKFSKILVEQPIGLPLQRACTALLVELTFPLPILGVK
ncbi:Hypothetical predicted protein [Olea europaea subsp. europaea]|uniref:Uncharacterized protein n=1 Tax=Olea europaea subsp. europaea TaxID=158383 RepID=A0A8S0REF9_OLEEU|nr:Hypothetical predicted protein [Olea europaea subsp. europaea]